ncbi:hypothetical protein FSP39_022977 [Pinctada imbricata]|uniref:Tc1-like transposase DDE domain-containing protein n=1 Tax=Pinctada imbricata TaxID=66713 RepID=A0AA88Y165_PINIB|nr:hypothetical protein FSP39_022977 [Pinctada imbricata]
MPRLNKEQRPRAVRMIEAGRRHSDVASHFGVTRITISRLASRYRTAGSVNDRRRSGRPRVTTAAQDRYIVTSHLRDLQRKESRLDVHIRGSNSSSATDVIEQNGPAITQDGRVTSGNGVVFSDESRYLLDRVDGRQWVYRRRGEHYSDACVPEVDRYGGGSIMVWGAISYHHRSRLVVPGNLTGVRYRDEILAPVVVPLMNANRGLTLFQQDNARCLSARVCSIYLQQQHVNVLPWPAKSPDLSPIEHLWDVLDRRIRRRAPSTLQELELYLISRSGIQYPKRTFKNLFDLCVVDVWL